MTNHLQRPITCFTQVRWTGTCCLANRCWILCENRMPTEESHGNNHGNSLWQPWRLWENLHELAGKNLTAMASTMRSHSNRLDWNWDSQFLSFLENFSFNSNPSRTTVRQNPNYPWQNAAFSLPAVRSAGYWIGSCRKQSLAHNMVICCHANMNGNSITEIW